MGLDAESRIVIPISALEHYSYCPRQCALIHVESTFDENVFTVRGRIAHERVDSGEMTVVDGVRQMRSVPLWSDEYGLVGKADVVEFPEGQPPMPVEYKSGATAKHAAIQLCAQALCLEEMLDVVVSEGALFSHSTKRRKAVAFDGPLRESTIDAVEKVRRMIGKQMVPDPVNDARCPNCSLINACLPAVVGEPSRIRGYQGSIFWPTSDSGVEWFGD